MAACLSLLLPSAAAAGPMPNARDEHTLHLWHLDEAKPPFKDDAGAPTELLGLLKGAQAGKPALGGFGAALSFVAGTGAEPGGTPYGPILLARPELATGPKDNVLPPFAIMGEDGAFTIDALVKLDHLPDDSPGPAAEIVSMDDEDGLNRVFLFRIEKPGFLSFLPISNTSVSGGALATIPTTGPHALRTGEWFHVAVTYDGKEGASNNLKLYWTRIGAEAQEANLIGRGTLASDLNRQLGDFAIGNTGRINAFGPGENFPGCIDEVRISSIARRPHDFCFVSPEAKAKAEAAKPDEGAERAAVIVLQQVLVEGKPAAIPANGAALELDPGPHRLDFDFSFEPEASADPLAVRCRLEGLDDAWKATARGMTLTWEMLDGRGEVVGSSVFSATGSSAGWQGGIVHSQLLERTEPLFIPEGTRQIRISMSSGTPDTTGTWGIDDFSLCRSGAPERNLIANGNIGSGDRLNQPAGVPKAWSRGGSEPGIARLAHLSSNSMLTLVDAEHRDNGEWSTSQTLTVAPAAGGETFLATWKEAYNVIPGTSLRATYFKVPSGRYRFQAISVGGGAERSTAQLAFPLVVQRPLWERPWFAPLLVAALLLSVAMGVFALYRRRARRKLAAIKLQHALEQDRARIARDLHDDLGTRVSLLNLRAGQVRGIPATDTAKTERQIDLLESAALDLVQAMDGLVWAVNPSNDSLEHLASHLSRTAQELFRDGESRIILEIPDHLPEHHLSADARHHFALGVKEALHNILKHAGPCEARLELSIEGGELVVLIADEGRGFEPSETVEGNGLLNMHSRFTELGGTCTVTSRAGRGTQVEFRYPLP